MSADNPIRVIVADDQPLIRSGLGAFLMIFDDLQLVGEAQDGEEAIQLCELIEPDVVILDMDIPRLDGVSATRQIRQLWPRIKVLVLSESKDPAIIQNVLDSGASACLTKDIDADDLAQAIHLMYQDGQMVIQEIMHSPPQREIADGASGELAAQSRVNLAQELAAAGKIQANLLPAQAPHIRGWDISAVLEPARETSGDFFDFIPLANNNWGIVIADVTDKGMGAALFMTLCSTLIRTYATQYPAFPALVMDTVNDRIQSDTRGDMFVTAFFGVLEPDTGRLRYVNAGHNPPILVSCKKGHPVDLLRPTGMVLGIMEETHWSQKIARLSAGDLLVLYTDGVTEAQDQQDRFFGEQRLQQLVRAMQGRPAVDVQEALLAEVHRFCGGETLQDDLALMVIARK